MRTQDEFAACGIKKARDIEDRFVSNFYFGREADDRQTAVSFNSKINSFWAKPKAMFSSDIGHWSSIRSGRIAFSDRRTDKAALAS